MKINGSKLALVAVLLLAIVVIPFVSACAQSQPQAQPAAKSESQAKAAAPAPAKSEAQPAAKPAESKAQTITFKMASFLPKDNVIMWGTQQFVDAVNQQSKGELKIEYLGGPEVMPAANQPDAMKTSKVFDLVSTITVYVEPTVPEATMMIMRKQDPVAARSTEFNRELSKLYQDGGYYYLGDTFWPLPFYLWTNKPVSTPAEMSKLRMRTGGLYDPFIKALGSAPVTIAFPDVYTSLERGMVDGFGWGGLRGVIDARWHEVTKNVIDHPFWTPNGVMLVNLETWNKLPKHLQDLMINAMKDVEKKGLTYYEDIDKEARQKLGPAGVKAIKFSDADAKAYLDLANSSGWAELEKKARPANFKKLKDLLTK